MRQRNAGVCPRCGCIVGTWCGHMLGRGGERIFARICSECRLVYQEAP